VVNKQEFRAGVRKLKLVAEPRAIDALFEACGKVTAGAVELPEMTKALKRLEANARAAASALSEHEEKSKVASRALLYRAYLGAEVCIGSAAVEAEEAALATLRGVQKPEVQLGKLLLKIKVNELLRVWNIDRGDEISRAEFRIGVKKLGWQANLSDVDTVFDSIDTDGGGTISKDELQPALEQLRAATSGAAASIAASEKRLAWSQKRTKQAKECLRALNVEQEKKVEPVAAPRQPMVAAPSARPFTTR